MDACAEAAYRFFFSVFLKSQESNGLKRLLKTREWLYGRTTNFKSFLFVQILDLEIFQHPAWSQPLGTQIQILNLVDWGLFTRV